MATADDIAQVRALLGRAPQSDFEVVVRDGDGMLRVIRNAPFLEDGDSVELQDLSGAAAPFLHHPILQTLIARSDLEVRAKLGWTDVAFFAAQGIPAANFGPGDATIAHTQGEFLERATLEAAFAALSDLLANGIDTD